MISHHEKFPRKRLKTKIVHLGFGAFHRAHQALFADELAAKSNSDWGYCEVNLFGGELLIEDLRKQDHLFSIIEKGEHDTKIKTVGSVCESLHSTLDGYQAVIEKMAEPQVSIVSITITEKGYGIELNTGHLDINHPFIAPDLANPNEPKSAVGCIVQALRLRMERGLSPISVMSCDNMPENGKITRNAVLDFANHVDTKLAGWIDMNISFPSTMVDRIVPAITEETQSEINQRLGFSDSCGIICEPFRQWVIEDNFIAGRPEWELVGVELVQDVLPFEKMKLRMLNGSHSFLAYLGFLAGYEHISDCMENVEYKSAARNLMMLEQASTLNMPKGTDLDKYADQLIERYTNPSIKHRTWQIAMDGSQKLPQRILESVSHHIENGTSYKHLALAIAAWMFYVSGKDENGADIDVRDPIASELRAICDENGKSDSVVSALLSVRSIFNEQLANNSDFVKIVLDAYQQLCSNGAKKSVSALSE